MSGPPLKIFKEVKAFDIEAEKMIIDALVAELNSKYGANLSTNICYARGDADEAAAADAEPAVILVGGSHASYLATALAECGYKAAVVEMRPWRPNSMTVEETRLELEAKMATMKNVQAIIYWCLDNAAYYSVSEDSILPAVRDISGKYHIHGSLITAPAEMFSRSVKACTPLLRLPTTAKKIVLSPLPRYWRTRCCSEDDHVSNLDEPDYETTLFSGLDGLRRSIKDILHTSGIKDVKIYNSGQLCVTLDGSRSTSTDIPEALAIMWGDDPVHPARDCYRALAEHLHASLHLQQHETSSSAASERPLKRPRWLEAESSTTIAPRDPTGGRGRGFGNRGGGTRGFRGGRRMRGRFRGRY
jgi:hypothetical protein